MKQIDWYFDYISPFAYLALKQFHSLPEDVKIIPKPILFAGLLNHFDTKGPAEIERMRQYTFRHISWLAKQQNIELKLPPAHPFNPLKALRLTILLENDLVAINRIFDFIWQQGQSTDNPEQWKELCDSLSLENTDEKITQQSIKDQLMLNTKEAIEVGVFGVPTFIIDEELFFGQDSMTFLYAYLENPSILESQEIRSADTLPQGINRK
ncbi:MAG: 2-hydroxychromene-2-carboxylate isomerase [Cocleimonas sp.]|jgi:2-hydroxychromene-2-carboxylate isomerase